tara:strand:- start:793 stop:1062 length:270 start_codon:yes stop_codon:yes gene_type:complete
MKAKFPDGYGEYNEYDFDNRISYDEETDVMYIYVAPPQGQVGSVMVYSDIDLNMISIDTDEVNTQVGIEIIGVSKLMEKFNLNKIIRNN